MKHTLVRNNYRILAMVIMTPVFALLPACGGGGGGAPVPDTTAPTVVSSTPATSAAGVSRIADLRVTVSEALNAATVTGTNVRLTRKNNYGPDDVRATVSYDAAANTITVNPSQPLFTATAYTLTLSNVQDSAGNTMASTPIAFKTYVNPVLRNITHKSVI